MRQALIAAASDDARVFSGSARASEAQSTFSLRRARRGPRGPEGRLVLPGQARQGLTPPQTDDPSDRRPSRVPASPCVGPRQRSVALRLANATTERPFRAKVISAARPAYTLRDDRHVDHLRKRLGFAVAKRHPPVNCGALSAVGTDSGRPVRRFSAASTVLAPDIEGVAQSVSDEVEAGDCERDRRTRV